MHFQIWSNFFGSVKCQHYNPGTSEVPPCHFQYVTVKQCYGLLRELNIRKPLCPSTVPAWAIIDGQSIIVTHLTFVNNAGIDENVFVSELKTANVKRLLQNDDPMEQKKLSPFFIMCIF